MDEGNGRLLRGAREIAAHLLGDAEQWRAIYGLAPELPLFKFGGRIAAYTRSIDEAMARKEAGGKETAAQMRRAQRGAR